MTASISWAAGTPEKLGCDSREVALADDNAALSDDMAPVDDMAPFWELERLLAKGHTTATALMVLASRRGSSRQMSTAFIVQPSTDPTADPLRLSA